MLSEMGSRPKERDANTTLRIDRPILPALAGRSIPCRLGQPLRWYERNRLDMSASVDPVRVPEASYQAFAGLIYRASWR